MHHPRIAHLVLVVALGLVHTVARLTTLVWRIFDLLIGSPLRFVGRRLFRWIVVPMYKTSLLISRRVQILFMSSKNGMLFVLTSRYTVHAVFTLLTFFVLAQNVFAKDISADEFGQDTILLSLVSNETQEITETSESLALNTPSVITGQLGSVDAQNAITESIAPGSREIASVTQGSIVQPNLTGSEEGNVFDVEERYVVKEGETISQIAEQFGVSIKTILDENGLNERSLIKPGQELKILVTPSGKAVRHEVKSGETLSKIASIYSVSEEDILTFNNLANADALQVGQTLIIDGATKPKPPTTIARVAGFFSNTSTSSAPPASSGGSFGWPSPDRRINQGVRAGHVALDINCKRGQNIFAVENATVSAAGWGGGYGLRVILNHSGGTQTLYGHFSSLFVSAGESVSRGQAIGACGTTGYSTGPHVHLEVRIGGRPVNPWPYLR